MAEPFASATRPSVLLTLLFYKSSGQLSTTVAIISIFRYNIMLVIL